jgi:hypothetical protein
VRSMAIGLSMGSWRQAPEWDAGLLPCQGTIEKVPRH